MSEETPRRRSKLKLALQILLYLFLMFAVQIFLGEALGIPDAGEGTEVRGGVLAFFVLAAANALLRFLDRPRGYVALVTGVLSGLGWGALAATGLSSFIQDGPGWPLTPWAAFAAATGTGLLRGHRQLFREAAKEQEESKGRLPRKAYVALALLVAGYATVGVAGYFLFRAFAGVLPGAGQLLTLLIVAYVLYGVKLLLAFSALEAAPRQGGFRAWFRANFVQNALVLAVLAAYAAFREDLATLVPYYPLWEFGFAVVLFGLVLQRLRTRLKRDLQERPVASENRRHAQRANPLTEPEYDEVAGAVRNFVERGLGSRAYMDAVRKAARIQSDTTASRVLSPVRAHREPAPPPPLPLPWGLAAALSSAAGFALFVYVYIESVHGSPRGPGGLPASLPIALAAFSMGAYRLGGLARRYHRPFLAFLFPSAAALLLLGAFLLFAVTVGTLGEVPYLVWGVMGGAVAILLLKAGLSARRLSRDLQDEPERFIPEDDAEDANRKERQSARKTLLMLSVTAATLYLALPPALEWAAAHTPIPARWVEGYRVILGPAAALLAGLGLSAGLRLAGLARERPRALEREKQARALRLRIHEDVMSRVEQV